MAGWALVYSIKPAKTPCSNFLHPFSSRKLATSFFPLSCVSNKNCYRIVMEEEEEEEEEEDVSKRRFAFFT